jgi:hypothetical protein
VRAARLGVVLLLAIWIASACGGPPKPPNDPRKNDITALWTQIRDWRREAGMQVEPRREELVAVAPMSVREVQRVCTADHQVPQACGDVCSLADAICDNAEQICILADELGKADTWAQDKCASAKASCREAKKKCCGCSEPTTTVPGSTAKAPVLVPKPVPPAGAKPGAAAP